MYPPLIESARLEDLPRLAELQRLLLQQGQSGAAGIERQLLGLHLILDHPHLGHVLVARQGQAVAGMICLLTSVSLDQGGKTFHLEGLIVDPDYRRKGLGQALLEGCIHLARDQGALNLWVNPDKLHEAARQFFRKFGFEESESLPLTLQVPKKKNT